MASLLAAAAAGAQDIQNLAKELSGLRAEVEQLSDQVAAEKGSLQDQLRTYARQKSELALELDRERMRLQKTRMTIAQKKDVVDQEKEASQALVPIFEKGAEGLRGYIKGALPFRVPERLAELQKIEGQLKSGLLTPQQAIARLWTMIEDEQRMTRDSGVFRQTVTIEGEDQLADIVRLGMVALYFKTSDGTVGHAQKTAEGWSYSVLPAPQDVKLVDNLFESFKKQIRVGYFQLPNTFQVKQ